MSDKPISDLRRRMIADMAVRSFSDKTRHDYIRHVETFASFLGRSPDTATGDALRRFQLAQVEEGAQPPKMNAQASALRFFFTVTLAAPTGPRHEKGMGERSAPRHTRCGIVGADAQPNWKDQPPWESLTGVQWRS
jgi:hypothetical protein